MKTNFKTQPAIETPVGRVFAPNTISPEDVMQEVESALGVSEDYNEYLGSKGLDMVDDEEWEDYIMCFMEQINKY